MMLGPIAPPADATMRCPWCDDGEDNWHRAFGGTTRVTAAGNVDIEGIQHQDGTISRVVNVGLDHDHLDAEGAREVAAAVIAAANEIDQLAGR